MKINKLAVICNYLLITISILLLISQNIYAELATSDEMERVCNNWLARTIIDNGIWGHSADPKIADSWGMKDNNKLLARCYNIEPDGYIVVPTLKELPPVMAFSTSGHISPDNTQGIGDLLLEVLSDRMNRFIEYYGNPDVRVTESDSVFYDSDNCTEWDRYTQNEKLFVGSLKSQDKKRLEAVGPLLTTAWSQITPYNNNCPMGDGNRTVVWCVATALAQILQYHQWPPAGFGHKSYMWDGDNSCGGSSPGLLLWANYSDKYEWGLSDDHVAEISFESGMAYNVDYGVCYSIGYTDPIMTLLPNHFGYQSNVLKRTRNTHSPSSWFDIIKNEINNNRPISYGIYNHVIVADGWQTIEALNYYHMNYGWGNGANAWYAIDNLYCSWAGCNNMNEYMYINILPDKEIMFYADTIAGTAPLELNFTASTDRTAESWLWDFGDGLSSTGQSPTHIYEEPGIYNVSLTIDFGEDSRTLTRNEYIYVLADSINVSSHSIVSGDNIEVIVSAKNSIPLSSLIIPIEYSGEVSLTFDSYSVQKCRTENFQNIEIIDSDPDNKRLTILLEAWESGFSAYPYLSAGNGDLIKLTFSSASSSGGNTLISVDGYGTFIPSFGGSIYGFEHNYTPVSSPGIVELEYICGDVDGAEGINILDIVYLINYKYKSGPAPDPLNAADVDGLSPVNILDIVYLINFKYKAGPEPVCYYEG